MKIFTWLAAAAVACALAACSSTNASSQTASSASPAAHVTPSRTPAAPVTAAAAKTAATTYFNLYAAGQYAATWQLLTPGAQAAVSRSVWVSVHQKCASAASGLSYKVGRPTMAGKIAVVKVSLAGALSKLGSEEQTFAYADGRWEFSPSDLSAYRGHTVAQAVAALKAMNLCG